MVRTIITPQSVDLHLSIPLKYVGKRVEITFLDLDEIENKSSNIVNNAARFKGVLNQQEAEQYDTYLQKARQEWDRNS
jgi:hypothetical protein